MPKHTYTVDWEEQVNEYLTRWDDGDADAFEELMDYIVELTQEAYLRGKVSKS